MFVIAAIICQDLLKALRNINNFNSVITLNEIYHEEIIMDANQVFARRAVYNSEHGDLSRFQRFSDWLSRLQYFHIMLVLKMVQLRKISAMKRCSCYTKLKKNKFPNIF